MPALQNVEVNTHLGHATDAVAVAANATGSSRFAEHGRECEWSAESDARRPATKQLVESLRVRIQALETEIEQLKRERDPTTPGTAANSLPGGSNDLAEPSASALAAASSLNLGPHSLAPLEHSVRPLGSGASGGNARRVNNLHLAFQSGLPDDSPDIERPQAPASSFAATAMYKYIFQIDRSIPTHLQSNDAQLSLVCDWSRYLPQLPDIPLTRLEHDILLLRCFKYGTSWLHGLVPEVFLHDMLYSLTTEGPSPPPPPKLQHYSPLLHCSILAFASAFSDNHVIRSLDTRARFAEHAKQWLDEEFGKPVMSLVPALALLAEYHCGVGDKDAGYMYMGMSFRAANICNVGTENNDGFMTIPDSIKRDWHYWSAFSCDKLMAIEYVRDYDMPIPQSTVSFPSVSADLDNQPWPLEPSSDSVPNTTPARLTTLVFHEACKLMIIATRVIDVVHNRPGNTIEEHMILNTHLRLDTWFNNLPENLLVWARSTSPLPHLIVLHICYWWLLIVLHQPLYQPSKEKEKEQPATEGGSEQRLPIVDLSVKMCDRAAHKVVQLITMFENQHGLRFFPRNAIEAIRACAIALLRELTFAPTAAVKKKANAASGVSTCINALRTISTTWPRAQPLADDLQRQLKEQYSPSRLSMAQLDGPATGPSAETAVEQQPEDAADISQVFYQYMHDWGHMPAPPGPMYLSSGPGSESPYSQPGDSGWEGL